MPLQFRRGTESEIQNIVPSAGEPIWTTDTKNLYIGDGSTLGGNLISGGGSYNQSLNTTDAVTFSTATVGKLAFSGSIAYFTPGGYSNNWIQVNASGFISSFINTDAIQGNQSNEIQFNGDIIPGPFPNGSRDGTLGLSNNPWSLGFITTATIGLTLNDSKLTTTTVNVNSFSVVKTPGLLSFDIDGVTEPTLTLKRGQTYNFNVFAPPHPFWIMSTDTTWNSGNAYNTGVTNNGTGDGTVTFAVPSNAPATLYYQCQHHSDSGIINIVDDDTQTEIGRYSTSQGITAKWLVEVKDSNSDFHSVEILTAYKGTDTYKTEYAELTSSGAMGTFKAEHTGSSVALYFVNTTPTAKTIVASKMLIKS